MIEQMFSMEKSLRCRPSDEAFLLLSKGVFLTAVTPEIKARILERSRANSAASQGDDSRIGTSERP